PTWGLVKDAVEAAPVEPVPAKGKAESVPAWRLLAVRARVEGYARRFDAPIVGRERELQALLDAFEQAVSERSCRLFTVIGDPGVGKSRLVAEFVSGVNDRAGVLRGRCLSYGEGITFWPLGEALREAAGITEAHSPPEAQS